VGGGRCISFIAAFVFATSRGESGTGEYRAQPSDRSGVELLMVTFTSGSCSACAEPYLPPLLEEAKISIQEEARNRGLEFVAMGVGVDGSVGLGMENLARFGEFDEVVLGRSWTNSAALAYMFQDFPGEAAVPQVVVLQRSIDGAPGLRRSVSDARLLARKVGPQELRAWRQAGFPLPMVVP